MFLILTSEKVHFYRQSISVDMFCSLCKSLHKNLSWDFKEHLKFTIPNVRSKPKFSHEFQTINPIIYLTIPSVCPIGNSSLNPKLNPSLFSLNLLYEEPFSSHSLPTTFSFWLLKSKILEPSLTFIFLLDYSVHQEIICFYNLPSSPLLYCPVPNYCHLHTLFHVCFYSCPL